MEKFKFQRTGIVLCIALWVHVNGICINPERALTSREAAQKNLITEAEKHLRVREATGSNDGLWVEKYLKTTGLKKGNPWCAAFQAYIHDKSGITAPKSARVVDWFKYNVIWEYTWKSFAPEAKPGQVGALYYQHLRRYGHIVLIVGADKHNYYTIEGNTNSYGSREGDGVYRKIRDREEIAALADYCVSDADFIEMYDEFIQKNKR